MSIDNIILAYPGRFQPFGKHHRQVVKGLQKVYNDKVDDIIICTSDKSDNIESPLDFNEKANVISMSVDATVLKTKSPYNIHPELRPLYDPLKTVVIYTVSEKDLERLPHLTNSRYYLELPFKESRTRDTLLKFCTEPYDSNVYVLVIPEVKFKANEEQVSGSLIRATLSDLNYIELDDLERIDLFKDLMGFYDQGIEQMLVEKFSTYNLMESKQTVISEGGGKGHISHIFEDDSLTFNEIQDVIEKGLSGDLAFDGVNPTEKVDGMNCQITFKDGECKIARNKKQIIDPITADQLVSYMTNPPQSVVTAYKDCISQFNSIFGNMSDQQLSGIFGENSEYFLNVEIIHDEATIEMKYDDNFIVLHNIVEYDLKTGSPVKTLSGPVTQTLSKIFNKVSLEANKHFNVRGPIEIETLPVSNYKAEIAKMKNKLKDVMSNANINLSSTVGDYKINKYRDVVKEHLHIDIDNDLFDKIVVRLALNDKKALSMRDIESQEVKTWLKNFESNKKYSCDRDVIFELEKLVYDLGLLILQNCANLLTVNKDRTVQHLRDKFESAIEQLQTGNDFEKMDNAIIRIQNYLKMLDGVSDDIIQPTEGLVFSMNNKIYKLTGWFGPIHTIASYYQFSK